MLGKLGQHTIHYNVTICIFGKPKNSYRYLKLQTSEPVYQQGNLPSTIIRLTSTKLDNMIFTSYIIIYSLISPLSNSISMAFTNIFRATDLNNRRSNVL